ncbi:hypothetical protein FOQG_19375 [Fusarium oxysporum f. sp. raphani 54005]|uniref:Zn(2)-C6 fungal-type domain-containing protein n=2 Tax=Fusarium oxysporum f. sp. raphani TaxID=96318 RepID=X0B286_FUSOX|nr:hypothetical protein FOQG_19375 [Fusarium oxysporum f. sp. raphani 54005]KAG7423132.1 Fluconazole resistance protein 1 [Fusarium oxysporum f. sp. raphani]
MHLTSKRADSSAATIQHYRHAPRTVGIDGRDKRVWKACERCRMKKTKCDGEFPCKRCKDDGLVCTAAIRRKMKYKQLPPGYAEVLENTQFAFIATIHKLYSMVVNNQPWELGEPELNNHGQPIIHSIAQQLGCIRPQSDIKLPVHSVFPENEAGLPEAAPQLEGQQDDNGQQMEDKDADCSVYNRTDQGPLSPQTFTYSTNDFGFAPPLPDSDAAAKCPPQSSSMPNFPAWLMTGKSQLSNPTMQFMQQSASLNNVDQWYQSLVGSQCSTISPHVLLCPNPEVMMGMEDPMIYFTYDGEHM